MRQDSEIDLEQKNEILLHFKIICFALFDLYYLEHFHSCKTATVLLFSTL